MRKPAKILIIRLGAIGDILLATPLIRCLRTAYPDARIEFLVKERFAELLEHNPYLSKTLKFDEAGGLGEIARWRRRVGAERYDVILDLHSNIRSVLMTAFLMRQRVSRIDKGLLRRFAYVHLRWKTLPERSSVTARYFEAANGLGLLDDGGGLDLFVSEEKGYRPRIPVVKDEPLVALVPGAGYFTKRWPEEHWVALGNLLSDRFGASLALVGGEEDVEVCRAISSRLNGAVVNLAGKTRLLESAAVLQGADLVITNDCGPMHMAVALKKKVVAIFGGTTEALGFFPYGTAHVVVENHSLPCRPCSHIGRDSCPLSHFRCMREITPGEVARAAEVLANFRRVKKVPAGAEA